jgi:sugar phosphate permease
MMAYNSLIFTYGWTAFINPIITTFGWSMTQIALASSLRTMQTGIFNPVWGVAVDRWSARKLMQFGVVLTALGIFCLSQTRNLAMYYAGFFIVGTGSSLVTSILPQTVIARWFRNDLGKATGLLTTGTAIGGVMVPLVIILLSNYGWQRTLFFASIGFLILGISLSFVMRQSPESCGMVPDGKQTEAQKAAHAAASGEPAVNFKQMLKMRAFWHLMLVFMFQNAFLNSVQTFSMPYLSSVGMMAAAAATVITVYTVLSLVSRLPIGWLSDIFRRSHIVALSVFLQSIGLLVLCLMNGNTPFWLTLVFGVTYGIGIAGVLPLRAPIQAEYFGRKNFGTIFGLTSIFVSVASVLSPLLAGWIWDTQHSFKPFWIGGFVLGMVALVVILTIPPAKKAATG